MSYLFGDWSTFPKEQIMRKPKPRLIGPMGWTIIASIWIAVVLVIAGFKAADAFGVWYP